MRGGIGPRQARQSAHNERTGKYVRQFYRTADNKARRIAREARRQAKAKAVREDGPRRFFPTTRAFTAWINPEKKPMALAGPKASLAARQ